jgi:hypothetical protein
VVSAIKVVVRRCRFFANTTEAERDLIAYWQMVKLVEEAHLRYAKGADAGRPRSSESRIKASGRGRAASRSIPPFAARSGGSSRPRIPSAAV